MHGVHGEPRHRQTLRQLARLKPHVRKLAKPVVADVHKKRCRVSGAGGRVWLFTDTRPLTPDTFLKLFQEAHVVLEEEAYVVEFVHEAAHAVYAEAEGEARELFGVNVHLAQDVRVNHPRAAKLYPARAFAEAAAGTVALEA